MYCTNVKCPNLWIDWSVSTTWYYFHEFVMYGCNKLTWYKHVKTMLNTKAERYSSRRSKQYEWNLYKRCTEITVDREERNKKTYCSPYGYTLLYTDRKTKVLSNIFYLNSLKYFTIFKNTYLECACCGTIAIMLRLMLTRSMYATQQLVNIMIHRLNLTGTTSEKP